MRRNRPALVKSRHFEGEIIILCVRRYLRYSLSYRDLEQLYCELRNEIDPADGPIL
jgi:transposase-like protein